MMFLCTVVEHLSGHSAGSELPQLSLSALCSRCPGSKCPAVTCAMHQAGSRAVLQDIVLRPLSVELYSEAFEDKQLQH